MPLKGATTAAVATCGTNTTSTTFCTTYATTDTVYTAAATTYVICTTAATTNTTPVCSITVVQSDVDGSISSIVYLIAAVCLAAVESPTTTI